jgi:hypothetical protein
MLRERSLSLFRTALLLGLTSLVIAGPHGTSNDNKMDMGGMDGMNIGHSPSDTPTANQGPMNYFRYPEHTGWIYGHILVMTLGWIVILPLGKSWSTQLHIASG